MKSLAAAAARFGLLPLFSLVLVPARPAAQEPPEGWNHPDVLELVDRAIARRSSDAVDSALLNYQAEGRGFVYFLLDAPELERQTLVRTDQVALEVYWRAPNQIRQRVVGLRERRELPVTRLYYYLDRLTVVQDNYGQAIVIADGDNVNNVPHPIASGAPDFYDYRAVDSLTLRLPGIESPVRVVEVQVRPEDSTLPAFVGSVFLEAATGALVRMAFTFTPSAYVDPRLDYINVNLENGLWRGRFWLPHEQRLEIRRELPELDLPFGTVIRTRMRVGGYQFNQELPDWLFGGPHPITFLPAEQRRSFEFDEPIDAELRLEGIERPADVEEIRSEARAMLRERAISGLPAGRLGISAASDVFRYNRAEGLALGAGVGFRPSSNLWARVQPGWAFGPDHPVLSASMTTLSFPRLSFSAFLNRMRDVGQSQPGSRLGNSLGSLFFADDWTDPFFASGGAAELEFEIGDRQQLNVAAGVQQQRSAGLSTTYSIFGEATEYRPVRPIEPGTLSSSGVEYTIGDAAGPAGVRTRVTAEAGRLNGDRRAWNFGRVEASLYATLLGTTARAELEMETTIGSLFGDPPVQELYLIGGRGTLPGFDYRSFGGDRSATATALASADIAHPWLRARLFGGLGWVGQSASAQAAAEAWSVTPTGGVKAAVGFGVGFFYDLLHVDVARGLGGAGETQVIIELQPDFWDFL